MDLGLFVRILIPILAFGTGAMVIYLFMKERSRYKKKLFELELSSRQNQEIVQILSQASRKFVEAVDEQEVIHTTLQSIIQITSAIGASFVPLDERGQPLMSVRQGNFPLPIPDAWLEYLASPSVRLQCKQCQKTEEFVQNCSLLKGPFSEAIGLICFPLRIAGIELGMLNLCLPDMKSLDMGIHKWLRVLIDNATVALFEQRLRRKEIATLEQIRTAGAKTDLAYAEVSIKPNGFYEYKVVMEERARLAREIHDGLAQTLGYLKLQIAQMQGYLEKGDLELLNKALHRSYNALAAAYQDAREAIDALRLSPEGDHESRIQDWIMKIVEDFEGSETFRPIEVIVKDMNVQTQLPVEVHAQLIRVVQEAMSNIRKHAGARHVWISCREVEKELLIEIRDDGKGFDVEDVPAPSQHGLRGMRERAELIGADFQIISQPGHGTLVRLSLPLKSYQWAEA